jgi:putative SOS response-associated peptidase YedK
MTLSFPEGIPNLQAQDIAITDRGPIVRAGSKPDEFELLIRRWSWPGPGGKPVYNFRSEGREFTSGRCLIIASGFYEFTKPADLKQKRKDRWMFTASDQTLIGIAGLVRSVPDVGEAFTMLTTEPGPDVAPFHSRQVAVLPTRYWRSWLDNSAPAGALLQSAPGSTLSVRPANKAV